MRTTKIKAGWAVILGFAFLTMAVQAAKDVDAVGSWTGTWEGGGAGGSFKLTFTKTGDALSGNVDVGQDTGDYSAPFTSASLEGGKLKARYDYPPEPQAEIVLEGAFEGATGTGTWTMVQKGGTDAFASGTWSVKK
jgi:hypothetical protein